MTTFPTLSEKEIMMILNYVDKEAKLKGILENIDPNPECDSCAYYKRNYSRLAKSLDSLRQTMIDSNGKMTEKHIIEPPDADPNADKGTIPIKVRPEEFKAEYYEVKVNAYGWYNIDDLVKGRFNAVPCELKVSVDKSFTDRVNVFIVLPEYKVFTEGGLLDNGDEYGFYINNGQLYLPLGANAYVFAVGEENGHLYFGNTQFFATSSQKLQIKLEESTKEKMENFLSSIGSENISMHVEKSKNFEDIRKIDDELNRIKSKLAVCSCGESDTTSLR
jgi:hypothetical protein